MAKHCETFEHTADIGLTGWGDTLGELFEALGENLADLICPREQLANKQSRTVRVEAEDVEALAVDFLTKILVTIQTDRFCVAGVNVRKISETEAEAQLVGESLEPGRHEFNTEVKAVTYHQLQIARDGDRWIGRVILDI